MAWLNAVPEDEHVPKALRRSRAQTMLENGAPALPLPPVEQGLHLVDALLDVGPAVPGMGGPVPLGYSDIRHWQDLAGWPLTPWEAQMLRRLSLAFVNELATAREVDAPPPMLVVPQDRETLSRRIGAALRAMAQSGRPQ